MSFRNLFLSLISLLCFTMAMPFGAQADPLTVRNLAVGLPHTFSETPSVWDGSLDHVNGNQTASMAYARYVKVTFRNSTAWVFVDEIEIWGVDAQADNAVAVEPDTPAYLAPGSATAGVSNLVSLDYGSDSNGHGLVWTQDKLEPYISCVDTQGAPQDWFYDGVLFSASKSSSGRNLGATNSPANLYDWNWYLDKTFAANGDMSELNQSAKQVGQILGQPDHKVKVMLMIPYSAKTQTNFGDVDGTTRKTYTVTVTWETTN